jgi:hypothetical protein
MAFRDWHARRVVGLCMLWPVLVIVGLFIRGRAEARRFAQQHADVLISIRVPMGLWLWLGPPALLVIAWLWARRSRPAG